MGRKPCIALLLCICSCSLDTSPEIPAANEGDASLSLKQQASLRFDAPAKPRRQSAVKRDRRDDLDAGDDKNDDAKPESRDAGRAASTRPAMINARDAGAVDAGDKHLSTGFKSVGDAAAASEAGSAMTDRGSDKSGWHDESEEEPRKERERSARGRSDRDPDAYRATRGKSRGRSDGDSHGHRGRDR